MVVVDEDKTELESGASGPPPPSVPPPPYQLHPGAAPPMVFAGQVAAAAVASTSSLNSYGAGASSSGSGVPLRHARSAGELPFNPYANLSQSHSPAPAPALRHAQAASYSHPYPHHAQTLPPDAHTPYRHSFHQAPVPAHLDMHRHSVIQLQPASPLSPLAHSAGVPYIQPARPPSQLRRHSNSPHPSLLGQPSPIAPMSANMTPEERAQEEGRRYHQQLLAKCAAGDHAPTYSYGPAGIISSVLLFPIGLICLFIDRERRCARCGQQLDGRRLQRPPPTRERSST